MNVQQMVDLRFSLANRPASGIIRAVTHIQKKGRESLCGEQAVLFVNKDSDCNWCNIIQVFITNPSSIPLAAGFVES